jgi:geranylgeranyl diphosphate synthase type II
VTLDLAPITKAVDAYLPRALELVGECPPRLREAMAYSLLAPGKRLRPVLTILACEAVGGTLEAALPAAAAVEMIHCYSLIHDDLPAMDDDDLRRGRPTCHKQFDEATAILAGDALLTLAFEVIAAYGPPTAIRQMVRVLAEAAGAGGMVGGQMLDLSAGDAVADIGSLMRIHRLKTGALFRACVFLGWHSAPDRPRPALDQPLERLDEYVAHLGLAFQITDDLLDVQGNAAATGKAVGKDAARGKLTYPGLLGVEESRRRAAEHCQAAVAAIEPLGPPGEKLRALVDMILGRDR